MINGNAREFVDGLYYGDERFFLYGGKKYFIQGYGVEDKPFLEVYVLDPPDDPFVWKVISKDYNYPVADFERATIFGGKTFWEVENEIEWVDC